MVSTKISPAGSLEGWNVKDFVLGNKEFIKIVIAGAIYLSAGFDPAINLLVAGIAKGIMDVIDYWSSPVVLN